MARYFNLTSAFVSLPSTIIFAGIVVSTTTDLHFLVNSTTDVSVLNVTFSVPVSLAFPAISGLVFLAFVSFVGVAAGRVESNAGFTILLVATTAIVLASQLLILSAFLKGQFELSLTIMRAFVVLTAAVPLLAFGRASLSVLSRLGFAAGAVIVTAGTSILAFLIAATPVETGEYEGIPDPARLINRSEIVAARQFIFDRYLPPAPGQKLGRRLAMSWRRISLDEVKPAELSAALAKTEHVLAYRNFAGLDARWQAFPGVSFWESNMSGALLKNATMTGARFKGVNLRFADFTWAELSRAKFDSAQLDGTSFINVKAPFAAFNGAHAWLAHFKDADLRFAQFSDADLFGARFANSDLKGASFRKANLAEADFVFVKTEGASFRSAKMWRVSVFDLAGLSADAQRHFASTTDLQDVDPGAVNFRETGAYESTARTFVQLNTDYWNTLEAFHSPDHLVDYMIGGDATVTMTHRDSALMGDQAARLFEEEYALLSWLKTLSTQASFDRALTDAARSFACGGEKIDPATPVALGLWLDWDDFQRAADMGGKRTVLQTEWWRAERKRDLLQTYRRELESMRVRLELYQSLSICLARVASDDDKGWMRKRIEGTRRSIERLTRDEARQSCVIAAGSSAEAQNACWRL